MSSIVVTDFRILFTRIMLLIPILLMLDCLDSKICVVENIILFWDVDDYTDGLSCTSRVGVHYVYSLLETNDLLLLDTVL